MIDIATLGFKGDTSGIAAYDRAMDRAAKTGDKLQGRVDKIIGSIAKIGPIAGKVGAVIVSLGVAISGLAAINANIGFEKQLSALQAVTQATAAEIRELSDTARQLGASTVFSARQAVEGMENLARAGFSTREVLNAIPGTLALAAAGQIDLARASEISTSVLRGFNLEASESGRVSDVLAVAAAKSNLGIADLGEAMKFAAPSAAALGISLEETTAILGKLADAGLKGGLGGRAFQSISTQLVQERDKIRAIIGDFDLEVEGLTNVFKRLAKAGISQAQAIDIFGAGNFDAFSILKTAAIDATSGVEDLQIALQNARGEAERIAKIQFTNAAGSIDELNGSFEELFLKAGSGSLLTAFRRAIDEATAFLRSDGVAKVATALGQMMAGAINATRGAFNLIGRNMDALVNTITVGLAVLAARFAAPIAAKFAAQIAAAAAGASAAFAAPITSLRAYAISVEAARFQSVRLAQQNVALAESELVKARALGSSVVGIQAQQAAWAQLRVAQAQVIAANAAFAGVAARTDAINRGFAAGATLGQRAAGAFALALRGLAGVGRSVLGLFGGPLGLAITAFAVALIALSRVQSSVQRATDQLSTAQNRLAEAFRAVQDASGPGIASSLNEFALAADAATRKTNELLKASLETRKRGLLSKVGVVVEQVALSFSIVPQSLENIKEQMRNLPTGLKIEPTLEPAEFDRQLDAFLKSAKSKGKLRLEVEFVDNAIVAARQQVQAISGQAREAIGLTEQIIAKTAEAARANELVEKGQKAFDVGTIDTSRLNLLKDNAAAQAKALDDLRAKFVGLGETAQKQIGETVNTLTNMRTAIDKSTANAPERAAELTTLIDSLKGLGEGVTAAFDATTKEAIERNLALTATIEKIEISNEAQQFINDLPKQFAEIQTRLSVAEGIAGIGKNDIAALAEVQTRLELIGRATAAGVNFKVSPEALKEINKIAAAAGALAAKEYRIRFVTDLDTKIEDIRNDLELTVRIAGIDPRDVAQIERVRAEFQALKEASIAFGPNIPDEVLAKVERYADLVAQAAAAQRLTEVSRDFGQDAATRAYDRQLSTLRESLSVADQFKAIELERARTIGLATAELERQRAVLATIKPTDPGYAQITDAIAQAEARLLTLSDEVTAAAAENVRRLREEILKTDDVLVNAVDKIFDGTFKFKDFFKDLKKAAISDLFVGVKTQIQQSLRNLVIGPPVEQKRVTSAIEGGANAASFDAMGARLESTVTEAVRAGVDNAIPSGFVGGFGLGGADFGSFSPFNIDIFSRDVQTALGDINFRPLAKDFGKELARSAGEINIPVAESLQDALRGVDAQSFARKLTGGFKDSIEEQLAAIGVYGYGGPGASRTPTAGPLDGLLGGFKKLFDNTVGGIGKVFSSVFGSSGPLSGIGKAISGIAGGIGKVLGPVVGGIGKAVGGIGGAISGAIGGIAKIAGPVVGAVAAVGSLFKGLFGKPSDKVGQVLFTPGGKVINTASKDQSDEALENLKIATTIQSQISEIVAKVLKASGGALADNLSTSFYENLLNVAVGSRDGIRIGFQGLSGEIAQQQKFARSEGGAEEAVQAGVRLALKNVTGASQQMLDDFLAMENITSQMVDDFIRAADRRSELEAEFLTYLKGTAGETLRAFNEIKKSQRAARAEVEELGGFSPEALLGFEIKLQNERVKFLSELSSVQREALRDVVSSTEFALADLLSLVNTQIDSVRENVVDSKEAFDRAKDSIRQFLKEFDFGSFGGLSLQEQFKLSLTDFRATLGRARIGDTEALGEISAIANRTLGFARELYASGPRFTDIRGEILAGLRELEKLQLPEPVIPETSPIVNELQQIKDLVNLAINAGTGTLDFGPVREALANATTLDPDLARKIGEALTSVETSVAPGSFNPINNAIALQGSQISAAILSQSPLLAQIAYNTGLLVGGTNQVAGYAGTTAAGIGALYDATIGSQSAAAAAGSTTIVAVPVGVSPQATATSVVGTTSSGRGGTGGGGNRRVLA